MISVRDFGAVGDGRADDTHSIRAAIGAASRQRHSEQPPGGTYFTGCPAVHFPAGKYMVTDTLPATCDLVGDGAILQARDPTKDIVTGEDVWRFRVSGLTFVGGKNQLHLGNANINTGQYLIERCSFYYAAEAAVRIRPNTLSTQLTIRDCVMVEPRQVLINYCDMATIADCWVSSSRHMLDQAAFAHHGMWLTLERLCLVPHPPVVPDRRQRWVDNRGVGVECRGVRFGGEGGGFCPVVNWTTFRSQQPIWPSYVKLDACHVYARGQWPCAIYCEEAPNQIAVRDCSGLIDIPVVRLRNGIGADYFTGRPNFRASMCAYGVRGNVEVLPQHAELPSPLRPYQH